MLAFPPCGVYDDYTMTDILRPRFTPPAGRYYSHNSGGEHAPKHHGDIADINALRETQGLDLFDEDELLDWMFRGGVHVVREKLSDGGAGDIVGYAVVARRNNSRVAEVKDVWVDPDHRNRGIGGHVVERTLFQPFYRWGDGFTRAYYPQDTIKWNNRTYRTFGIVDDAGGANSDALSGYLDTKVPDDLTLVRTTPIEGGTLTEVIANGEVVDYRIKYHKEEPEEWWEREPLPEGEKELWALEVLNRRE